MDFLDQYFNRTEENQVIVSGEQGSDFAKQIATDFNPIHDADAKRFCVPGDLLFALALREYGLHKTMTFNFLDLVSADTPLSYPKQGYRTASSGEVELQVVNNNDKPVLGVHYHGGSTNEASQIEALLRNYVAFSGQNFPHILVPLMKQHDVMINPKRPLVIYQSMSFEFSQIDFSELDITLEETELKVNGKRGDAKLFFSIMSNGQDIGSGIKTLVLSGLREYDEIGVQDMVTRYLDRKKTLMAKMG